MTGLIMHKHCTYDDCGKVIKRYMFMCDECLEIAQRKHYEENRKAHETMMKTLEEIK